MKRDRHMTIEEHRAIAEFLRNPLAIKMRCDIPNSCGKTSPAAKSAVKFEKARRQLISDMEEAAYKHGHVGIDIYYPLKPDA